jgi:hypothetical protein
LATDAQGRHGLNVWMAHAIAAAAERLAPAVGQQTNGQPPRT